VTARRRQGGHGVPNEERFGVSQVLAAGPLVYVAGQIGRERDGTPVADRRLEADFAKAVANLDLMLAQASVSRADLVHVQSHTTVPPGEVAALHAEAFGAVGASGWCIRFDAFYAPEFRFEISAVATRGAPTMDRHTVPPTDAFGFATAVRAGPDVFVSAQEPLSDDGALLHEGDLAAQYGVALDRFLTAVRACGADADDVVATWIYVVGLAEAGAALGGIAERHRQSLGAGVNRPTASLIGVAALPTPGAVVAVTGLAKLDAPGAPAREEAA
jgi:enamine deaminase RidA (YjgF/YER057c/UK114 family)